MNSDELKMRQLVLWEMAQAIREQKPLRLYFAPGTEVHRQVSILAMQRGLTEREIVEMAIRSMFYEMLAGVKC